MAKTITVVGNTQVDTAQKKFGTGSALFDGTGDYLTLLDSDDWNFGAGNFTVDFWIRFNDVSTDRSIFEQYVDGSNRFDFYWYQAGSYLQLYSTIATAVKAHYTYAWTPSVNTWYHIALVRNTTTLSCYVGGTALTPTVISAIGTNDLGDKAGVLRIGYVQVALAHNGWMDEFRISKGIARWTSNFTPPTSAYSADADTHLLIHCDGIDESTDFYDDDTIPPAVEDNAIFFGANF